MRPSSLKHISPLIKESIKKKDILITEFLRYYYRSSSVIVVTISIVII